MKNVNLFLIKLKRALNFKTDKELAAYLGINRSTIANWKQRNWIDYDLIFDKIEHLDLDYNCLIKNKTIYDRQTFEITADEPHTEYTSTAPPPDLNTKIGLLEEENSKLKSQLEFAERIINRKLND